MATPPITDTLTSPVHTDSDVLFRVEQLIDVTYRFRQSLWLFFLDANQAPLPVVVPIEDVPDDPDPELVGNLCWIIAEVLASSQPDGSVVITLTRPGPPVPGPADRVWHGRLRDAALAQNARIRMMCLATPDGAVPLVGA
ncbi:MAG TPA: hypothetical protein VF070_30005 [Streptosporangiaceae bacterium]